MITGFLLMAVRIGDKEVMVFAWLGGEVSRNEADGGVRVRESKLDSCNVVGVGDDR